MEKEVEEAMQEEDEANDLQDLEDEEEFSPRRKAAPGRPITSLVKKQPQRAIQVKKALKASRSKATSSTAKNKRALVGALQALSKRALEPTEDPSNSILAALLAAAKPIPGIESVMPKPSPQPNGFVSHKASVYTPQLEGIARALKDLEPTVLHVRLLNLLFRSVGGSQATNLPETTDFDDLDDDQWDTLVTTIVQNMQESDLDLLTANPVDKLGAREYKKIYKEFWYRLGGVLLSHVPVSGGADLGLSATPSFWSSRFQVESMRDLLDRVTELVLVGQPDLRAGATTAVWELAVACLERTVELGNKLAVAQRQYAASKKQPTKAQALKQNMDSWKRHKAELEALVEESVIQGVFIRRYRDSNPYIRCESLETLSRLTLLRPDVFLKDKYLKYLGWMASDKAAPVRLAALQGLLAPFKHPSTNGDDPHKIDLQAMQNVCGKFLPRIAECTMDSQDLAIQEVAMELIVKLTNEGFLDDWDDDEGWDQLNLKALDSQTTPLVRKNALYLILDQLDCFDEGDTDTKSTALGDRQQVIRIDSLARW